MLRVLASLHSSASFKLFVHEGIDFVNPQEGRLLNLYSKSVAKSH